MDQIHDLSLFANVRDRVLKDEGILITEGKLLTARLFASGLEVLSVLCAEGMASELRKLAGMRCPVHVVSNDEMERLAGFRFHRGVMAAARRPALLPLERFLAHHPACRSIVICPGLTNDVNQGGIVRTAAALGADAVCISTTSCDLFSRRALKASMGAALTLPIVMMDGGEDSLALLKNHGFTVYGATTGEHSVPLESIRPAEKRAVVFGNEADGIPAGILSQCDQIVHVPMHNGTDSLNVGVAAGIVLYELLKR
jgi:tRNA G18 (ribose-2'-O)-methylase SpoU